MVRFIYGLFTIPLRPIATTHTIVHDNTRLTTTTPRLIALHVRLVTLLLGTHYVGLWYSSEVVLVLVDCPQQCYPCPVCPHHSPLQESRNKLIVFVLLSKDIQGTKFSYGYVDNSRKMQRIPLYLKLGAEWLREIQICC